MAINELLTILQGRPGARMRIPALWNGINFPCEPAHSGECYVDGPSFFIHALENLPKADPCEAAGISGHGAVYSLLARHFTAWDHGGGLCGGTFLKALCLLPHIKSLGAMALCLLPIFEPSDVCKKGSLGSPYAIKDFFKLDPALHDPLLGNYSAELLDLEFKAFVEACHMYGLSVMLDFVFRTCARDNVLLKDHPDWFYWIDSMRADSFAPPRVPSLPGNTLLSPETARLLYASPETQEYIKCFRENPRTSDPELYDALGGDLAKIEEKFGVTTAPAFSDVLNDRQPHWSDVTYLRLDLGKNEFARRYDAPPFVLQDAIKLDIFPAARPNAELWDILDGVIPHYIEKYDIDGARIDMGHALPKELLRRMVTRAKEKKPGFLLWSEIFDISRSKAAKDEGFDFVTGDVWGAVGSLFGGKVSLGGLAKTLFNGALPSVSAPETPDTPRSAQVLEDELLNGGIAAWKSAVLFCVLLPNVLPLWNSGLEIGEKQPMNLGIGESAAGRYALPESDPDYGLLAFFDACRLHWTNEDASERIDHIRGCMALRDRAFGLFSSAPRSRADKSVFTLILSDESSALSLHINRTPEKRRVKIGEGTIAYRSGAFINEPAAARRITLEPYGAVIISNKK